MFYYAVLQEGICCAVIATGKELVRENVVPILMPSDSFLGMRYEDGQFVETEQEHTAEV